MIMLIDLYGEILAIDLTEGAMCEPPELTHPILWDAVWPSLKVSTCCLCDGKPTIFEEVPVPPTTMTGAEITKAINP